MPVAHKPVPYGPKWLHRRQIGHPPPLGSTALQTTCFYDNLNCTKLYDAEAHGGIFSLEFNPQGSLLIAACENKSLLLFDPLNPKLVKTVENAHADCVNCVKFIDSHSFATCSDDSCVVLWDIRNLNKKLCQLVAHTNWVKSIDYAEQSRTLVTSGFDGAVFTWDLSQPFDTESSYSNHSHTKLFSMNGLMRSRMSPDGSKLILSTTAGYIIVIHNLDLDHAESDLRHLKPNMYRLMQLSQQSLMPPKRGTDLFKGPGKRNRVEFICDFPERNDAEVIASIQVHPEGHSVLSRNTSHEETSEWSCVHSIEENLSDDDDPAIEVPWKLPSVINRSTQPSRVVQVLDQHPEGSDLTCNPADVWEAVVAIEEARAREQQGPPQRLPQSLAVSHRGESSRHDVPEWSAVFSRGIPMPHSTHFRLRSLRTGYEQNETARRLMRAAMRFHLTTSRDVAFSSQRGQEATVSSQRGNSRDAVIVPLSVFRRPNGERGTSMRRHTLAELRIENGSRNGNVNSDSDSSSSDDDDDDSDDDCTLVLPQSNSRKTPRFRRFGDSPALKPTRNSLIHQNIKRLHYLIEEPNVVRGFIKEPSFSSDGRIICSPYKVGIRLLAFSPELHLPWQCPPDPRPADLEVRWQHEMYPSLPATRDAVVSTRFSSLDNQIVAGTLHGKIVIYSPFR